MLTGKSFDLKSAIFVLKNIIMLLYFVRSGYVSPSSSRLNYAGNEGDYWSGRANSSSYAYEFYFYSSRVLPSSVNNRYSGFSVRCVTGWEGVGWAEV
mgnify:FL=1